MDIIGLVKDSFEAVVSEVEGAYQRNSTATDDQAGQDTKPKAAVSDSDQSDDQQTAETHDTPSEQPMNATDTETVETENQTLQASDLPQQFQLLSDVMQQAAMQLSSAAESGSFEQAKESSTEQLDAVAEEQASMRKLFESKIHSDEVQARTLERLHGELQASRKQIQRAEMAPLLKDIIFCHDFVTRELDREDEPKDWRQPLEVLGQMLLDVLFKYDVEPFRAESDDFDRSSQQCVKTEYTTDEDKDRSVSTRGLTGFRGEDRIIRREQVTVFRYRAS